MVYKAGAAYMHICPPGKGISVLNNELNSDLQRDKQELNNRSRSAIQLHGAFNLITSITTDYCTHVMQTRNYPHHYNPRVQHFMSIKQHDAGIRKMHETHASSNKFNTDHITDKKRIFNKFSLRLSHQNHQSLIE